MSDLPKPNQCPVCNSTAIENYCSNCGQKIYSKRFTLKSFFGVIGNALNLERGIFYTMVWLFRNPGKVIDDYLNGRTKPYLNPLNYILIIAGIYAFLALSLNIFETGAQATYDILGVDEQTYSPQATEVQAQWTEMIKRYMNFVPIIMLPFASLASKWYFRKKKLYYGEHLILITYVLAQSILISVVLALFVAIIPGMLQTFPVINTCLTIVYFTYAFYSYFKRSVFHALIGFAVVYGLGFILMMTIAMIVVILVTIAILVLGGSPFGITP
ncbi:DUF3667 domain-containing protein [uncultured Draconibacterium sp.]|uniref:DUF3667 domain-containing protein n=1 Tax=uncultured Draconibacterium sp. TaxID=1573823 RepID=UPI002AA5F81F|nr:DUF3667 domain-containing protein [uncultured Draconibacterium sp.]